MNEPLLSPASIGGCQLNNRIVMTAASLCRCTDGFVSEDTIDFYQARARGGVGLIMAGAAGVDPTRRSRAGMMQACADAYLPGLTKLTQRVHQEGGKIFLQLLHPGAYANPAEYGEAPPLAPSSYFCGLTRVQTQEMTPAQIAEIVGYFAQAAVRAQTAGFDGVELCASVGYLLAEFLSHATNHRTDAYGGSLENRMRFLLETVDAVRQATGSAFPLTVRLSGMDLIPDGNTLEDQAAIGMALEQHGVDGLSITGGWHESRIPQITAHVPHGAYRFLARALKQRVSIPVIASNRMDLPSGRQALADGDCDLIGLCRPLIADPNLVQKLRQGRAREIRHCLSCNQECLDRVFGGKPVGCTVNPQLGQECAPVSPLHTGKKILVVGAGVSGLAYASLAAAGNAVTVWERSGEFGGAARLLAQLPHWEDCGHYVTALYQRCLRLGVSFCWHQDAAAQDLERLLQEGVYDQIILATGAQLRDPEFPCDEQAPLCSMQEWMERQLPLPAHTVILGNDFRALEFALLLSNQARGNPAVREFFTQWFPPFPVPEPSPHSPSVTCLGRQRKPGAGMAKSVLWAALQEARQLNLHTVCNATVQRITNSEVIYEQDGETKSLPAQLVLLADGWKPSPLAAQIQQWDAPLQSRMTIIGDAKAPGKITQAVQAAYRAALHTERRAFP